MEKSNRILAAVLALLATTSILAGINALARTEFAHNVVTLPTVEIAASRAAEGGQKRAVR